MRKRWRRKRRGKGKKREEEGGQQKGKPPSKPKPPRQKRRSMVQKYALTQSSGFTSSVGTRIMTNESDAAAFGPCSKSISAKGVRGSVNAGDLFRIG